MAGPADQSKSVIKRALDRAKPNCLDSVIRTCWSSTPGDGLSKEEREFADDMDIGTYYLRNKNYRGAEFRFRHALDYKPSQPDATFKLAEALDKLGKRDEAKQQYETYLESQANGLYAERARTALQRLSKLSVGKN
jgi:Tfp pilus assembly protein PilF